MWSTTFAGILLLIVGLFLYLFPETYWKLTEQWKSYYADEPSDFYLKTTKFGGILFAIVGVGFIIAPFILK